MSWCITLYIHASSSLRSLKSPADICPDIIRSWFSYLVHFLSLSLPTTLTLVYFSNYILLPNIQCRAAAKLVQPADVQMPIFII